MSATTPLPVLGRGNDHPARLEPKTIEADLARLLEGGAEANGSPHGGVLRFSRHDRLLYATDASLYQVEPIGVVVPRGVDEAARVVGYCGRAGVPLLARGGGTSLAGQCTAPAVVLDLSAACRAVRGIDFDARTCEAEPGVTVDELNESLARSAAASGRRGVFFAPDPATTRQACIGGCVGNNAAGARSVRYGRTSENIAGLDVALSTGERLRLGPGAGRAGGAALRLAVQSAEIVASVAAQVRARFPKTIRRNAGYGLDMVLAQIERGVGAADLDLTGLLCGSEGTLAVTLGATLKLHPVPRARRLVIVAFDSVEGAIDAVRPILATRPTAVELLDDVVLEAALGNSVCRRYVEALPRVRDGKGGQTHPSAVLYVEYSAEGDEGELGDSVRALGSIVGGAPLRELKDATAMAQAWALRRAGEPLLHGLPGRRKPVTFVEDNAVPVENLGRFVAEFKKIVARHGTRAAYWAHASVGVLHVRPMIDLHDPADLARLRAIAVEVADLARECGGIMSGEHGDGKVRGPLLERFFGPEIMDAFAQIKRVFDPAGVLNPGNIVGAGPIESISRRLRISPTEGADLSAEVRVPDTRTYFDYSDQHGFAGAVEMCNGSGVCRKRSGGVMCPSYMATLDERHSTRGRANAVRLAVTGQLRPPGTPRQADWNDEETLRTLDLCLSCKACKSECPSNVDMARLKSEYLAQGYRVRGGAPLRARVLGHVRTLNRLGSLLPGLANFAGRRSATRWAMRALMGISPRRSLPPFARSLYRWQGAREPDSVARSGGARVALFADCFTAYNEPRIGIAAIGLLEQLGYTVDLPVSGCCGRAMISSGLLEEAAEQVEATVGALRGAIEDDRVRAIVVCEPSCLSAFKDDWLSLRTRAPRHLLERLAEKAVLVDDFVDRYWEMHPRPARVRGGAIPEGRVLLHGHCHQKALFGSQAGAALLRRLVGDRLRVLDTGCCGMAGAFGFDERRFELSLQIGELGLLPAVRTRESEDVVVAPGTSCRHQILDGTGCHAVHPIELAALLLEPADGAPGQ